MHFSGFAAALPGLLSAILATGCAARYQQPEPSAPHAIVTFPSQAEQWGASLFLEPVEFNGVSRPRDWMRDSFRVPPGELRLLVRAAREDRQGTCLLIFPVTPGESYAVHAESGPDAFTIRAARDGRLIANCDAPKTLLPTPLGSPPGTPPR